MESELQCPVCLRQFVQPVLLPCSHPVCLGCARSLARSEDDLDKCSVYSEADSGVALSSRPGSCLAPDSLTCVTCGVTCQLGEGGLDALPPYLLLDRLLPRFGRPDTPRTCQLCEGNPQPAAVLCRQCQVHYCTACRERCHPSRGPLATHTLLPPGGPAVRRPKKHDPSRCWRHPAADCDLFCVTCDRVSCPDCRSDGKHRGHNLVDLKTASKQQKTHLSQTLQTLSERAKSATEVICRLKKAPEMLLDCCTTLERSITEQCDQLVAAVRNRQHQLIGYVRQECQQRSSAGREQVTSWTGQLHRTTGLLQFCIETLKEPNPVSFLQMGAKLQTRADSVLQSLDEELRTLSDSPSLCQVDLTLDTRPAEEAIRHLSFSQMKPPCAPTMLPEECSSENNSVVVAWRPDRGSFVEGHLLELDDGNGGPYTEVYCGPQTVCTIDGLHFNSVYRARVRSYNATGPGPYGPPLCLQTAELAWFTLDPGASHSQLKFSADNAAVSCDCFEPCVAMATTAFSRGVHYWEFSLERYDGNADPAFGVAKLDVTKSQMLGADPLGWSMYIDGQRSWFMHAGRHENRREGGVRTGTVVGVLLDLCRGHLSYYVDGQPQGPVAFTDLKGTFYPAVSINRNCKIRLNTALEPPSSDQSATDSDES